MTGAIPFVKMHGLGNDYVYVDGAATAIADPVALAQRVSDRHFGVGSDGLILVLPPEPGVDADVRMRMWNADGSESEMCGNGVRCVCKFARDRGLTEAKPMRVQTGAGVLELDYERDAAGRVVRVRVDMGVPELDLSRIPVDPASFARLAADLDAVPALAARRDGDPVAVGTGNPHVVIFVRDLEGLEAADAAPFERHAAFPRRTNVHLVAVRGRGEVAMKTWERGSGATLACGTGATAVCVAGAASGRTDRAITAHLPGGALELDWNAASGRVFMTGPAVESFTGVLPA